MPSSAAELRAELRALRKEKMRPVSRMKLQDISVELDRLRGKREETPAPAATPSGKSRAVKSSVETIQQAKASEFPTAPVSAMKAKGKKAPAAAAPAPEKKNKLSKLMKMLNEMSESDAE